MHLHGAYSSALLGTTNGEIMNNNQSEAMNFGRASAREAFDQVKDYDSIIHAIAAYRTNVRDTCHENAGWSNHLYPALAAYDAEVTRLQEQAMMNRIRAEMVLDQFTQTNVRGVLERANEFLTGLRLFNISLDQQEDFVERCLQHCEPGDTWERASLALVAVEIFERNIRDQDPNVEKFPKGWNGGVLAAVKE
jgi:hypothetical protein